MLPLGAACGGDDDVEIDPDGCDQAALLPMSYRPVAMVSNGAVATTADGDVTSAVIDATAGGIPGQADNPYTYVDLAAGEKVSIDDVDALSSDEWDLAFKRSSVRSNGGDSGPGDVAVAVVDGSIDDAIDAPADSQFTTDDWTADGCELSSLPFGEPTTAFGEWYDYDVDTHLLTPKPEVHVVRSASGDLFKLSIETYYGDDADPTRGAVYRVSWAPL